MAGCGCGNEAGGTGGPFAKGKELVDFVCNAHGGTVRNQAISQGPIAISCHGCQASFHLSTYVDKCPECGGVHAVAPMHPVAENVQFAGADFILPE